MDVYHTTTEAAARAIVHEGFRDHTGCYMTTQQFTGVWVADRPLDYSEGCKGDTLLGLTIPDTLFVEYEWVEEGKPYREALIDASAPGERAGLWRQDVPAPTRSGEGRPLLCRKVSRIAPAEGAGRRRPGAPAPATPVAGATNVAPSARAGVPRATVWAGFPEEYAKILAVAVP
jgi:hypothetical protein